MNKHQLFFEQVLGNMERMPDKPALTRPGESEISYDQLRRRVNGARRHLSSLGLPRGTRVILAASRSFSFVYVYLALHSLGLVAVPLDPQTTAGRLEYIKEVLNSESGFWVGAEHGFEDIALFDELSDENHGPPIKVDPSDLADIMFTSGTTAQPKGVCLSQGNLACAVNNINMYVGNDKNDIELNPMPLSHSFGLARLRCTLYAGGRQVLIDGVANPKKLFSALKDYRVTGMGMVAPAWNIVKKLTGDSLGRFKDQLKYLEFGSAYMPAEEKAHLAALLPKTRVCMHYGLTEASRAVFQEFHEPSETLATVGRASPLAEIAIFNETGQKLPPNEIGEICIKGDMVTKGYLNYDNAQVFWGDFFRTGDLGYKRQDHYVVLTGRLKEMINVGGKKVSPTEVDLALASLPGIREAACIGIPDPLTGEAVAAFVVADGDKRYTITDLNALLVNILEAFQIPRELYYIDEIPKTVSGKIQRTQLKSQLASNT